MSSVAAPKPSQHSSSFRYRSSPSKDPASAVFLQGLTPIWLSRTEKVLDDKEVAREYDKGPPLTIALNQTPTIDMSIAIEEKKRTEGFLVPKE